MEATPPPSRANAKHCRFELMAFTRLVVVVLFIATCGVEALANGGSVGEREIDSPVVSLENPSVHLVPINQSTLLPGGKAATSFSCKRAHVSGLSRWKLKSYANAFHITLKPSEGIPERSHGKIGICFHRNISIGHCECSETQWVTIQNGFWDSLVSPYGESYIDVKFMYGLTGSVEILLEEVFQQWRLVFLGLGFVIILLAPVVSKWVPFYYSSSMFIGVLLVIIILLFQGMKLLPTGRKSAFYLALYGSMVGIGSYIAHYFSMIVNSTLESFGLSQEMHKPVSVFVVVGILLAGAALGYWGVRKFVLSKDGNVDTGVAVFAKWAMRVIGLVFTFESSCDTPLALMALASGLSLVLIPSRLSKRMQLQSVNGDLWHQSEKNLSLYQNRAEFLSRSPKMGSGSGRLVPSARHHLEGQQSSYSYSPVKGVSDSNYYSTFHKTPTRRRFSKKEWEDFTRESTKAAIRDLASSPEFTDWLVENANRIEIMPENSSEDSSESEADSSGETTVGSNTKVGFFKWA